MLLPACLVAPHRCLNDWPTYLSFLACVHASKKTAFSSSWKKLSRITHADQLPISVSKATICIKEEKLAFSLSLHLHWRFLIFRFQCLPSTPKCQNVRKVPESSIETEHAICSLPPFHQSSFYIDFVNVLFAVYPSRHEEQIAYNHQYWFFFIFLLAGSVSCKEDPPQGRDQTDVWNN